MPKKLQKDKETSYVPMETQQLFNEFAEIVADDMPKGIPPMIIISHQVDLVQILSLPNEAPYKMTPTDLESKEIYRQVQQLLNPCAIAFNLYNKTWKISSHL